MDGTEEPATKRCKGSEQNEQKLVDGITDFKKGQRDFTPQSDTAAAISADFTSKEKEYTNGVVAPTLDTFWILLTLFFVVLCITSPLSRLNISQVTNVWSDVWKL